MKNELAIIGEFNPASETHAATNTAIEHSKKLLEIDLDVSWISTKDISENLLNHFHGFSVAPGSPYNNSMCAAGYPLPVRQPALLPQGCHSTLLTLAYDSSYASLQAKNRSIRRRPR